MLYYSYTNYYFFHKYMHDTRVWTHIYGEVDIPRLNIYTSVKKKKALVKNGKTNEFAINLVSFNNSGSDYTFEF